MKKIVKRNSIKKYLALILASVMTFISTVPVQASATSTDALNLSNYNQYTIDLKKKERMITQEQSDGIDEAISYVESLNLDSIGYAYIEDACLSELQSYRQQGMILEKYTVLVPKTRTAQYYGTYLSADYYYDYTSVADMRRETPGDAKAQATEHLWDAWMELRINIALCFLEWKYTVPYTIITAISDFDNCEDVFYDSYNLYVEQFANVKTRTIYKDRGTLVASYSDQQGTYRARMYFCPVGVDNTSDFIEVGEIFNGTASANNLTKDEILRMANVYANHNGMVRFELSNHRLQEIWGE